MRLHELIARIDGIRVLAGQAQTGRQLLSAYTTDLTDPGRYLSGGELVLTSGLWWDGDPAGCRAFAETLNRANAAALGFGVAKVATVPDALVAACRDVRLPLLELASGVSFQAVTEAILTENASVRTHYLSASLTGSRQLHEAAAEDGLDGVLRTVAAAIDGPCWLVSPTGRVRGGSAQPPLADSVAHLVTAERAAHRTRPRFAMKLPDGTDLSVHVVPTTGRWPQLLACAVDFHALPFDRRDLIDDAARVIAVIGASGERASGERGPSNLDSTPFLVSVLDQDDADAAEIAAALRACGIRRPFDLRAVLARSTAAGLAELVLQDFPRTGTREAGNSSGDAALFVGNDASADFRGVARAYFDCLQPLIATDVVHIGIGESASSIQGLRRSLLQARAALNAADSAEDSSLIFAEDLKSARFLLAGLPPELLGDYRAHVLADVIAYDKSHGSELEHTLRVFLELSASYVACAKALHLHVNTVRYRIRQVHRLTGLDVASLPDQVTLYIAVHAVADRS